jgi:predicted phosphodiesterase
MSVSHNFTTQDPEIGLAKTNELADMPAADRAALTGSDLLTRYVSTGMRQRDFWRAHLADVMTFDAFHGRLYRARKGIRSQAHLFTHDLGAPWRLTGGDWLIVGDVQLPTTNYDYAGTLMAIAEKHLRKPRKLILAGDFINADAFSDYDSDIQTPRFEAEVDAAETLIFEFLKVFSDIYWIWGNHERRVGRKTHGALSPAHLRNLVTPHRDRVHVSHWGWLTLDTPTGEWRVTHSKAYSVQQLNVADQLAQKFQQNIVAHHEHHCAIGWDRYKRYVTINNGGLFDPASMGYVVLDDSKMPNMQRGFTMMRGGFPTLFGPEPMTDYDRWL